MNEQTPVKTVQRLAYLPAKCLTLFATTLGSLVILVAPFTIKLVDALGLLGTIALSLLVIGASTAMSHNGLRLITSETKEQPGKFFLPLSVYVTSLALQISAIVCALRIIVWALAKYANLDVSWFTMPNQ